MSKKEMAMWNELIGTVKALTERIEVLEKNKGMSRINTAKTTTTKAKKSENTKKSTEEVVGNLIFSGRYVKTGTGYMSSKTRYAIRMAITEVGGVKLGKGNPVYGKCVKTDKYVQVYEFKTVEDCEKFKAEQYKRLGN